MLTNDGDIVNEILRSENEHEKEYMVSVNRPITDLALRMMASGVKIMGMTTKPCRVERVDAETFRLVLTQGLNRQIRRMCSALGYRVRRLQRVRIISIHVGALRAGEWRYLSDAEVAGLLASVGARCQAGLTRRVMWSPELPPTSGAPWSRATRDPAPARPASGRNHRPGPSSTHA